MFSFSLISVKLEGAGFSPSLVTIALSGPEADAAAPRYASGQLAPAELSIPYDEVQASPDAFFFLRWRSEISKFARPAPEFEALHQWAKSPRTVSAKLVTADGGMGKSRLAAEFAGELRRSANWAAGFLNLEQTAGFRLAEAGTLAIVDYPEERRSDVGELLRRLASLQAKSRLRLLLLSRKPWQWWEPLIDESKASGLFDGQPLELRPLSGESAYKVFASTQERCSEILGTVPRPFPETMFLDWLGAEREHGRPLFIMAAGVHSASIRTPRCWNTKAGRSSTRSCVARRAGSAALRSTTG